MCNKSKKQNKGLRGMEKLTDSATDLRVVIIGAGMAGILASIKMTDAGYHNHVIYEKSDQLGGTWRDNTYPGITCDVPAHGYTYSFEPNPDWSQTFAPGPEIKQYFERVADKYDVRKKICFNESVNYCAFENEGWTIRTTKGREERADIVIAATGVLHIPSTPKIDGLERFKGSSFHSARWDHSIDLAGKKVGVIGTGSTAIQITSAIVDKVEKFSLFQRTAQWVMPIENQIYSDKDKSDFKDSEKRGVVVDQIHADFDNFSNGVIDAESPLLAALADECLRNLEEGVRDKELREKLRPDYRAGCKRLIFSTDFYESIQRDNANLITSGIATVEENGIRTEDGEFHELDVLVVATGFKADAFIRPATVLGRDGIDLDDAWSDYPSAYMSVSIPKFPNFFMLNGPNSPVGNFSLIQIAENQLDYLLQLMNEIRLGNCSQISATRNATEAFEERRIEATKKTVWNTGCKSWYLDKNGIPSSWPWSRQQFFDEMERPELEAFERL